MSAKKPFLALSMLVLGLLLALAVVLAANASGPAAVANSPSAATHTVGLSALCNFNTIEAAIAAANPGDTLRVEDVLFNESPLAVNKDLILVGGYPSGVPSGCLGSTATGHTTVQRTGVTTERILRVENATVNATHFVFRNNLNGGGASVSDGGTLNLEDVIFEDNVADFGAGLHVVNATANLTNCVFSQNRANLSGGGMDVWGPDQPATASLTEVAFRQNIADNNGAGLFLEGDATVTTNELVTFDANEAANNGGAIYVLSSGQLTINAAEGPLSYLLDNWADGHGGGIYVSGGSVVLNGVLDPGSGNEQLLVGSNRADADGDDAGNGGGIYATNGATVQVSETLILDNSAVHGGGLYLEGSTFAADGVYFNDNNADADGGGIWAGDSSTVTLNKGTQISDWNNIQPNSADNGGGIYAVDGSKVTVDASVIGGNMASERGGGVYLAGASIFSATHEACIERNYTYQMGGVEGGGIYATGSGTQVTIDASEVSSNTAITRGGGLYLGGGASATVQNEAAIWGNETLDFAGGGGGAYVSGSDSTLTVNNSQFSENHSSEDGGGIFNDEGAVYLYRTYLVENRAYERGGGLFNEKGIVEATEVAFLENEAHNGDGGGLYSEILGSEVIVEQGWFVSNLAPAANGGGVATYGSKLDVHRSHFIVNSSDLDGSALFVTGACCPAEPMVSIVNSFIVDNATTATSAMGPPGTGSSLYVEGIAATVTHNTFARQVQESFAVYVGNGSTVTLTNNIISNFVVGIRRLSSGTGTATASYTLYHNNFNNYDLGVINSDDIPNGDPAFVGGVDYHLTESSDAIDAGTDAGVTIDVDGEFRPWGDGFDMGADEYPDRVSQFLPLIVKND